ncbi:MAG: MFS transporter [Chloroflexi bacterium]|nr:MFS transporter [Chloroflexota bacterium]
MTHDDRVAALAVVFGFSVGLGVATVAIPLLALTAGYDPASIGFLTAIAAATQLATRLRLPWLLGRFPDRTLIALSSVLMLLGFGLLAVTTALPAFVAAQLLQGAARGIFWTSSQAHAVRDQARPVQRLVDLNVAGNAGTLVGPALAGSLAALGLPIALAAAALGGAGAAVGSLMLRRLPPFDRRHSAGSVDLLGREGVDVACWASTVGGAWWSMIGSYVPVILVGAGIGPAAIGWLITGSEAAGTIALLALRTVATRWIGMAVRVGAVTAVAALVAVALAPQLLATYVVLLLIGGAASGTVTTMAPAMASLVAGPDEQGDALSLSGTFRAAALFGAPAAVGGLLSIVALSPALLILAATVGLPGLFVGRRRRPAVVD